MSSIIRNIGYLLIAAVAARFLGVAKSLWLARLLDPADYGALVFIFLLAAYAPIFSLGTVETLLKKVPYLLGRGDRSSAAEIEKGTFTFILILAVFFAAMAIPVPLILGGTRAVRYVVPARLMLLSLSFTVISAFFTHRLEAYKRFDRVSSLTTARSVSVLVLQVALTSVMGLTGAVLGFLLSEALVCALSVVLSRALPATLGLRAGGRLYGMLITTGIPITIVWWTYIIQTSVDRVFSMTMLGEAATGLYGIGMSIAAAYLILPEAINQAFYPSANEKFGQTGKPKDLVALVVEPARLMSLLLPLVTSILVLGLPLVFHRIVPAYAPALGAAQILLIGALYSALTRSGANFLVSVDRQGLLLLLVLGSLVLNVGGNLLFISFGWNIAGIAAATAVSSAVLTVAVWFTVFSMVGLGPRARAAETLQLFGPALIFTALAAGSRIAPVQGILASSPIALLLAPLILYIGIVLAIPGYRRDLGFARARLADAFLARIRRGRRLAEPEAGLEALVTPARHEGREG